ncbi:wd repeat domain 12 [Lichtheimia corymbifera JMRC:FSU:9682]|uniref:Ribosome biogenesis protein YTM1 n=1 Tax=Lichtheimia corymbifera JMRC:FSU:9682 TaxID=1263082 RepID=A0A068SFB2_9FUNG|nr:wd repeat domain 12 [Lichtheimia corymbifera JMRC:FSU:9682]
MDVDQEQVQVRFVSRQPQYAINDAAILVPSSFRRYGLSEIVNNLLGNEKPIPFEFFIDEQILKTSIAEYLTANRLSTENTLTIEYVESMLPPTSIAAFQHDDWISSVKGKDGLFLTGSYDGMTRLWNSSGECVTTFQGHSNAVKSVAFAHADASEQVIAYSGSLDHSILAWKYSNVDGTQQCLFECKGHKGSVESIAVDPKGEYLASASSDGTVKVWTTSIPAQDETMHESSQSSKQRKTTPKEGRKIKSRAITLEGHVGAVNAVAYDANDANIVYTGGWDHSIRSWDVEQQVNLVTKNCEKVVIDVDYSGLSRLIATGHSDNSLRLWDPRTEEGTNVKMTLRGHLGWVSSVSWSPSSEYSLCSGSYDGTVRVWDIRSKGPLYTLNDEDHQESDKVYAVDWNGKHILSGGEDKKLRIYQA